MTAISRVMNFNAAPKSSHEQKKDLWKALIAVSRSSRKLPFFLENKQKQKIFTD